MIVRFFFVLLFVVGSTFLLVKENILTRRVLILHSYNFDYEWTRDVDIGIKRILDKDHTICARWHYMDTKTHPETPYKEKIASVSRRIVDQFKPSVIIAVDDDAQEYVAKYYINHPDIKIIFAGVTGTREQYGFDKANNVTGILERAPVEGVVNTLQVLNRSKKTIKIVHIGDCSKSVRQADNFFHSHSGWQNIKIQPSMFVSTFDEWKKAIIKGGEIADYIIISNYRQIYKNKIGYEKISPKEVMQWTIANAKIPIIGTNLFVFEDGANLAIATSPYEQGEVAATFALKAINEGILLPYTQTKQFVVGLDEGSTLPGKQFEHLPKVYAGYSLYLGTFREHKSF